MLAVLILASLAVLCQSTPDLYKPAAYYSRPAPIYVQPAPVQYVTLKEAPKPYSFGYNAPAIGGGSSRHETSDGNGRVTGSYTVTDADGRLRVVDYYADETGFHANVHTNEPGTANQNPADVTVQSYAGPAVSPFVSPKVVASPELIAPAPIHTIRAPIRRIVSPLPASYRVLPTYNPLPASYGDYYGSYSPYKLAYYK